MNCQKTLLKSFSHQLFSLCLAFRITWLILFWLKSGAEMFWSVIFVISYLFTSIAITRVRAEAGGQLRIVRLVNGVYLTKTLVVAAISHWFLRPNRSHFTPSLLGSLQISTPHCESASSDSMDNFAIELLGRGSSKVCRLPQMVRNRSLQLIFVICKKP